MLNKIRKRYQTSRMIRNAIDTYPDGICFSKPNGRVVLANKVFNSLCRRLTGHSITNASDMWQELEDIASIDPAEDDRNELMLRLASGEIWRFRKKQLEVDKEHVLQIEATDVTELAELQNRLAENNRRVSELHGRQRELLKNIVQNNLDNEMLNAKIRIHDEFGRLLIMTKNALDGNASPTDAETLRRGWIEAVAAMENAAAQQPARQQSPREELVRVAEMIGCHVEFRGTEPRERKALLLLYAAVREALTNAVRHAGADRLIVQIAEKDGCYDVRISDNGHGGISPIREGSGLTGLRKRLERERATLNYDETDGLILILKIPKE